MKLSEDGALKRSASMSRRKQLRPFKVQDDDDDDGDDKNNDNGTSNAKQANTTDANGLQTPPNGNSTDETLHSTPESGKFTLMFSYVRVSESGHACL